MDDFILFLKTREMIQNCVSAFEHYWDFLHCVGKIGRSHIEIQPPKKQAFTYNYKTWYCVVFLAVCDHVFTSINVESPGQNDALSIEIWQFLK